LAVRQPTVPVNIIEYCQSGKFFGPLEGNEHVVLKTRIIIALLMTLGYRLFTGQLVYSQVRCKLRHFVCSKLSAF